MVTNNKHSENSVLRERIVEHVFVGEALKELWRRDIVDVEVMRSEFDAHGYDLVMAHDQVVRHIQFKTGTTKKPGAVSVSLALGKKPSGCVIWIQVSDELRFLSFHWFGGAPGQPLPPLAGFEAPRRATHNSKGERPLRENHRMVTGGDFEPLYTMSDVLEKLFGPLPGQVAAP